MYDVTDPESARRGPTTEELDDANQRLNYQDRDKVSDGVNDEDRERVRRGELRRPNFKIRRP